MTAELSSTQDNVTRFRGGGIRFYQGSEVRFKATNNSSKSVITQTEISCYNNVALLEPYGAYYSGGTVYTSSGSRVIYNDVYYSDNYVALINSTNFPDANFRSYMLSQYPKGYITQTDVNNCTEMNIANKGISNLKGIQYFRNLKTLLAHGNSFDNDQISWLAQLTNLETFYCANNSNLTALNLSNKTTLKVLDCGYCNLTSLNLSGCTALQTISCNNNKFTTLIITNHPRLTTLYCNNNTSLTTLTCYQNNLSFSNFFVNGNTALTKLSCYENPNLTGVNGLEDCRAITYIDCEDCAITDLSALNSMNNIENIFARNNKLTTFTVVGKSNLTTLRLSGNTLMTELKVYSNNLTSFYITNCTGLKTLWC